eukprot:502867-Rhodomonas_salina.1
MLVGEQDYKVADEDLELGCKVQFLGREPITATALSACLLHAILWLWLWLWLCHGGCCGGES